MIMDEKIKRLISTYIDLQMEDGKSMSDILEGCQSEILRQTLENNGLSFNEKAISQITPQNLSSFAAQFVNVCEQMGFGQDEIAYFFDEFGFTTDELDRLGMARFALNDRGYVCGMDTQTESASSLDTEPPARGPRKFVFEDYTLEECPFCETEVVIRATGVSACPKCNHPILPCTVCSSCTSPCPYDSTGQFGARQRPTNPALSEEEIKFYIEELERRMHNE